MTPRDLIAAFDTIADAPKGIEGLRELILQLAVRGRLVEQEPSDEPAAVLRNRIASDAAEAPAPRVRIAFEQEHPFTIPETWEWVYLGQAMGLVNGRAFKPTDWSQSGTKIVRIQNLNDPSAGFNYCAFDIAEKFFLDTGDLLLSWSGTPGTSFGAFIWRGGRAVLNQHIFRCEPRGRAWSIPFLRLAINSRLVEMIARAHGGVGLQHVTKGELEGLWLPLPPYEEQHRIAARFDELMGLLDRLAAAHDARDASRAAARDAALARLREATDADEVEAAWKREAERLGDLCVVPEDVKPLRAAVLDLAVRGRLVAHDARDEPVEAFQLRLDEERLRLAGKPRKRRGKNAVPDDAPFAALSPWRWASLEDLLADGPTNGWSPKAVDFETPVLSLKLSATTSGTFRGECFKYVDGVVAEDSPLWLEPGDLLIQRSNTPEYVGMAAIFDGLARRFIYPDLMMRCRTLPSANVRFVHLWLVSPYCRAWFRERASGTSSSMVKVGQDAVRTIPIPLPPSEEQVRIVAKVDELMNLLDRLEAKLREAQETQAAFAAATVHHLDVGSAEASDGLDPAA